MKAWKATEERLCSAAAELLHEAARHTAHLAAIREQILM